MKILFNFILILMMSINLFAQSELENLVATEKAFAQTAAEKNTKEAFLEFAADDAINFSPNPVNAIELWNSRSTNSALLAWTPEFGDISANGVLGYTTGPWEFRPKGKDDNPVAFGHFVTIWQKQTDGKFKFVLDLGIDHSKVDLVKDWITTQKTNYQEPKNKAVDIARIFFETTEKNGLEKAYKFYAAEDIRLYRQGKNPFLGKKTALEEIKKNPVKVKASKRTIFTSAQDLAYLSSPYSFFDKSGREIEHGNFLQIWKLRNGNWQIVLDLFKPDPKK